MIDLIEDLTIWAVSRDRYGTATYTRNAAKGRIAHKQEKFTDKNGDQQISKAVCYSDSEYMTGNSIVFFGVSTSDEPDQESNDVRALSFTPSYTNLKKAWF